MWFLVVVRENQEYHHVNGVRDVHVQVCCALLSAYLQAIRIVHLGAQVRRVERPEGEAPGEHIYDETEKLERYGRVKLINFGN